jgi:hypothetical protein
LNSAKGFFPELLAKPFRRMPEPGAFEYGFRFGVTRINVHSVVLYKLHAAKIRTASDAARAC